MMVCMSARQRPSHAKHPSGVRRAMLSVTIGALAVVTAGAVVMTTENPWVTADAPQVAKQAGEPVRPAPMVALPDLAPESEPQTVEFSVVTAGDVLPHGPVNTSARASGQYDYAPLMQNIRPFVENADIAICHMEVPVSPPGQQPSGYPVFGAPKELVPALKAEGWDACTTASNHSVDRRWEGVVTTLDEFDAVGLGHAGTARTKEESLRPQMFLVRDGGRWIRVANISFSYGTNGLPLPADAPWSVNLFNADASEADPIIDAARSAREMGADVVIASVHCCVEYRTEPTSAQRRLVERIAQSGQVDLYVGHHGHVPQPIEKLVGGPYGDGMWAAFGLGNYLSNQDTQCCRADTNSGVLMTSTFTVDVDGTVAVDVEWTATTVDRLDRHTMHVLADIQNGTGRISARDAQGRYERVRHAVGDQADERTAPVGSRADSAFPVPRKPWSAEA